MPNPTKANKLNDKTNIDLNRNSPYGNERKGYSNHVSANGNVQNAPTSKLYFGLPLRRWLFLYGLFAATVITWVASHNITQFKQLGPVAFQNGFPGDLTQWSRRGGWENILFEQDGIKLHRNVDKASYAVRTFALAPSENRIEEKLNVTALIKTITKKPASDPASGGAVTIRLQDDSDKVVKYVLIGRLDGLSDQYEINRVINLTENITRFSLVFYNKQSNAEFALVDASASLVTELPAFRNARIAIFVTWSIIFLITLYYLFTHASKTMFAVIGTVILLTFVGVLMPETIRSGAVKPVLQAIQNLTGPTDDDTGLRYAYKIGHFVFFFLSTLILLLYRHPLKLLVWEIFTLMILFAIATEGLQLYLLDRSTRVTDLIIDFSAILFGAILAASIVAIKAISSKKSKPPTATP